MIKNNNLYVALQPQFGFTQLLFVSLKPFKAVIMFVCFECLRHILCNVCATQIGTHTLICVKTYIGQIISFNWLVLLSWYRQNSSTHMSTEPTLFHGNSYKTFRWNNSCTCIQHGTYSTSHAPIFCYKLGKQIFIWNRKLFAKHSIAFEKSFRWRPSSVEFIFFLCFSFHLSKKAFAIFVHLNDSVIRLRSLALTILIYVPLLANWKKYQKIHGRVKSRMCAVVVSRNGVKCYRLDLLWSFSAILMNSTKALTKRYRTIDFCHHSRNLAGGKWQKVQKLLLNSHSLYRVNR